jgi:hypothetical protein
MLDEKAREAFCNGKLPPRWSDRTTWKRAGSGAICALCDEPVTPDQMELEIEVKRHRPMPETYSLHVECYEVCEYQRVAVERSRVPSRFTTG